MLIPTRYRRGVASPHPSSSRSSDPLYTRRNALKIGLSGIAGLSALGLVGCGTLDSVNVAPTQGAVTMQMLFWGTATRDTRTRNALDLYHKQYPGTTITSHYTMFNSYWDKLDRLIAAGKTPDLIQMDMRYLSKYVRGEHVQDLTQLIDTQTIDLSDFDPLMLAGSRANNSIYGIPLGGNYLCVLYDTVLLGRAGVGAFPDEISWDGFANYMTDISHALGKGIYGTNDSCGDLGVYEIWVRQRGKELYTVDGQLAFGVEDVAEWFAYWSELRRKGGCVPENIQAALLGGGAENSTLIHNRAVVTLPHSNEFESYQALTKHALALHGMPVGAQAGLYFKPAQLICISAQTQYMQQAASFVNFLVNDPNGVKAIGIERGVPGSPRAQALLRASFTPAQQQEVMFTNAISSSGKVRLKEVLDPPAASQVAQLFLHAAASVATKQASASDSAKAFSTAAQKALR